MLQVPAKRLLLISDPQWKVVFYYGNWIRLMLISLFSCRIISRHPFRTCSSTFLVPQAAMGTCWWGRKRFSPLLSFGLYCKLVLSILNTSPTCFDHVVLSNINVDQSSLRDFFWFFCLHIECDIRVIRIAVIYYPMLWVWSFFEKLSINS